MENEATDDDTSTRDAGEHGHDCSGGGGGRTPAQDSVQSASVVTEVGSSGNAAAAEETRRHGRDDGGRGEDGWLTLVEKNAVDDYYDPVEAETVAVGGDVPSSSPMRLAAARFGWLLLGFLAGAAAAVLFLMQQESPTTCTVTVPT